MLKKIAKLSNEKVKELYSVTCGRKIAEFMELARINDKAEAWAFLESKGIRRPGRRAGNTANTSKPTGKGTGTACWGCDGSQPGETCFMCGEVKGKPTGKVTPIPEPGPAAALAAVDRVAVGHSGCCDSVAPGRFCGACGTRKAESKTEGRSCADCGAEVTGRYCSACGTEYNAAAVEHAVRVFDGAELEGTVGNHPVNSKGKPSQYIQITCRAKGSYFGQLFLDRETYGSVAEDGKVAVTVLPC